MEATKSPSNILSAPAGALMRPTLRIAPEDSLERAAIEMRRNGGNLLPVVDGEVLCGVVTELSLGHALAEGVDHRESARMATVHAETVAPYATGAEALRRLADGSGLPLVVVDDLGRPLGLLSSSDLYPRRRVLPRPAMVGGMATPFGVYLTNGVERAGAKWYGLMATGATMLLLLLAAAQLMIPIENWMSAHGVADRWAGDISAVGTYAFFLLGMRLVPLSGTHGAEHQVVHAIERGEELVPEVIRRMPRVHPRCGTNLAVAAILFMSISSAEWIPDKELRFLAAVIFTFGMWRPLGSLLQQYVTTRKPNDKQLEGGIRAAEELLAKCATSRVATPSFPVRLWNSGLFLVMAGSLLMFAVIYVLTIVFHLPIDIGTIS